MSRTRRVARIAPHRAVARSGIALGVGTAAGLALSLRYSTAVAVLGGWNAGGLSLLALAWLIILSCDARATGQRAAAEDPGRTAVTVLVLLASLAGVLAVTVLVRTPEAIAPKEHIELVALCLATVIVSWTLTHTAFTLRYAHLYYREDQEGIGGADFPGGARPSYLDFAYLAFTVGMTFQVSDTNLTTKAMRRVVLRHALLSWLFGVVIVAMTINLVAGLVR